ncbi:MAG: LrgB family protein [Elsteraceae bacterium]
MTPDIAQVWVYLQTTPLLWLTATFLAYLLGVQAQSWAKGAPWVSPVLIAVALLIAALSVTGVSYGAYFDGAQFIHFLLGPTTVALAVPLWRNRQMVRRAWKAMAGALVAGSLTAIVSTLAIGWAMGASPLTLASLAPKSVTTPIAMGVSEKIGGLPSLTAAAVIATGILGSMVVTPLFNAFGLTDWRARGFAAGVAAHGIGTARAFQVNEIAGAFAGVALALNGLVTALLAPLLFSLIR